MVNGILPRIQPIYTIYIYISIYLSIYIYYVEKNLFGGDPINGVHNVRMYDFFFPFFPQGNGYCNF